MWAQAGFQPDDFWQQTPRHYQLVMRGVRKRLENEREQREILAHETGAFSGLAHHGKLKALSHYQASSSSQTAEGLVAMLKSMGAKSDMVVRRITLDPTNDRGEPNGHDAR